MGYQSKGDGREVVWSDRGVPGSAVNRRDRRNKERLKWPAKEGKVAEGWKEDTSIDKEHEMVTERVMEQGE